MSRKRRVHGGKPTNRAVRGQAVKGQMAPWFLKTALSKPAHKLKPRPAEAA